VGSLTGAVEPGDPPGAGHRERPRLGASEAIEADHDYGMARGRVAEGARPLRGRHPLVLLSHGAFGSARNYSWITEHLARSGFAVAGIPHYRESPAYGPETIDPDRIGALGHSSGGATVIALGGAVFDLQAMVRYCASEAARADPGHRGSRSRPRPGA